MQSGDSTGTELGDAIRWRIERPIGRGVAPDECGSVGSLLKFSSQQTQEFRRISSVDRLACIAYVRYLTHGAPDVQLHDAMIFVEEVVIKGQDATVWWSERCEFKKQKTSTL